MTAKENTAHNNSRGLWSDIENQAAGFRVQGLGFRESKIKQQRQVKKEASEKAEKKDEKKEALAAQAVKERLASRIRWG